MQTLGYVLIYDYDGLMVMWLCDGILMKKYMLTAGAGWLVVLFSADVDKLFRLQNEWCAIISSYTSLSFIWR